VAACQPPPAKHIVRHSYILRPDPLKGIIISADTVIFLDCQFSKEAPKDRQFNAENSPPLKAARITDVPSGEGGMQAASSEVQLG
jgi:hypothetical protein